MRKPSIKKAERFRNYSKELLSVALGVMFLSMQFPAFAMYTGDTGLGDGLGGATINGATGGYKGTDLGNNSATLNFNGDAHVKWDNLNLNSNETMNFNAVDGAKGITVLNTVTSGNMSQIYGTINSNSGVGRLIISNSGGLLFDGATFTTAGDTMLTTQDMTSSFTGGKMDFQGTGVEPLSGIVIKDSNFSVGGQFNIVAPSISVARGYMKAGDGVKFVTADGQNYLASPTTSANYTHKAVRLETVKIDGDVYIVTGKDVVNLVNGGEINGDLSVVSQGSVAMNYNNSAENRLKVSGDVRVANAGQISYLRDADVGGDIRMTNRGGVVEIAGVNVEGNVDLITTNDVNKLKKHFVHVVGDNNIKGNLNVDSIHNIHIGGYDDGLTDLAKGSLNVGGDINAVAHNGSIAVTVNTTADNVSLESGTLNIISDDKAVIKANTYQFKANGYIGGIDDHNKIISSMEEYKLYAPEERTYLNIDGGTVSKIETAENGLAVIRANNDMHVTGVNADNVVLSSAKDITILGDNIHADKILVDGETDNLTVENEANARDYTLHYTNIRDAKRIVINKETEITYDMANGTNGWNINEEGRPDNTTYLVVPGGPTPPPTPPPGPDPEDPDPDPEPERHLREVIHPRDVYEPQAYTPIAFAADLDDEIDNGVRKNVDGSVTVVRAFTKSK